MSTKDLVAIVGAGRIGRTLGTIITSGNPTIACRYWDVRPELRTPGFASLDDLITGATVILFAVSSTALRSIVIGLGKISPDAIIVTISKGAPSTNLLSPAEFFLQHLPEQPLVVIGGPMMAEEMSVEHPGEAVIASRDHAAQKVVLRLLRHAHVVTTTSDQPIEVSRAGVLKNIYACITGMIDGGELPSDLHHHGHQLARKEYLQTGQALGIPIGLLRGPAGLGDLQTTMSSPHSRNRRAGEELVRHNFHDASAESLHSFQPIVDAMGTKAETPLLFVANEIVTGTALPKKLYQLIATL